MAELVDILSDANDVILERVSINLDEAAGASCIRNVLKPNSVGFIQVSEEMLTPSYWKYPKPMLQSLGPGTISRAVMAHAHKRETAR